MREETEEILQRFVEKAKDLRGSKFVSALIDSSYKISYHQGSINVTKPDYEAIRAFLYTFRFFILENEATSFLSLKKLLKDSEISDQWKETYQNLKSAVDEYMKLSYGEYKYGGENHRFTNQQIFDTFLYGGGKEAAHANKPKVKALYNEWKKYPEVMALLDMWFITILQTRLRAILFLATICEAELHGEVHGN